MPQGLFVALPLLESPLKISSGQSTKLHPAVFRYAMLKPITGSPMNAKLGFRALTLEEDEQEQQEAAEWRNQKLQQPPIPLNLN
ncbi:hypothetical protein U1Q18_041343 [Sarracenia purpurea var. burkii]